MELILANGEALDAEGVQLQLNLVCPLFNAELLSGSYAFPFDLVNSPRNSYLLGLPHVVDVVELERDYEVRLDNGLVQMPGRLRVLKATPSRIRTTLLLATGRLADQLRNKKLNDLELVYDIDPLSYRPHLDLTITGVSTPPPDWVQLVIYRTRPGQLDVDKHFRYQVPWQGSVNATLARLAARYATAKPIRTWNAGTTYNNFPYDYVTDGSAYFRSKANGNVGNPLPPPATPDPWWTRYNSLNDFLNNWFFDPAGENEDHPLDPKSITLEMIATDQLRIWDDSYGTPWKLDFILIASNSLVDPVGSGSWTQLLQNVDPAPVFDINEHANALMSQSYPDANHVFFPIYDPKVLENSPTVKHINYFRRVSGSDPAAWATNYRAIAPAVYVWYVFDEVMKELGLIADKSFLDLAAYSDWKQLVMQSQANMIGLFNNIVNNQNSRPIESLSLKDHVPAISLADFLKVIRSVVGVELYLSLFTNTLRVVPVKDTANKLPNKDWSSKVQSRAEKDHEPNTGFTLGWTLTDDEYWKASVKSLARQRVLADVANIAALPSIADMGDVRFVTSEEAYYRYVNDGVNPPGWVFWSWPMMDMSIAEGSAERRAAAAPLLMYRGQDLAVGAPAGRQWLIPQMHVPLIDKITGDDQSFTSVRLAFYKGLHTGSDGFTYPLATWSIKNYGGAVIGTRSICYRGTTGIYELDLKDFLNLLLNGRSVSLDLLLDELDLQGLAFDDKVSIDGIPHLIESLRMALPVKAKSTAKLFAQK